MTEWISVEDRLPEIDASVLTYWEWDDEEKEICINQFFILWWPDDSGHRITHWMPLPTPPKGETDGEHKETE